MRDKRQSYRPVRRREGGGTGRKFLAKLLPLVMMVIAISSIVFFSYQALCRSNFFQIAAIEINGCQRLTEKEVLGLSGVDVHSNLVKLNVAQVEDRLARHSWIERVKVTRKWPDRLTISVKERSPAAIISLAAGLYYVDRQAVVFAPVGPMADLDYPVITGFAGEIGRAQTESAALQGALLLIKYASQDNPNLPAQNISEISIRDKDMVLYLMDRPFPIRLGQGDIWKKYKRLTKVLYWLYKRKEFDRVAYVYYAKGNILVGMGNG